MKAKSSKFSEARAARLAAAITSREADAATHRADLTRVMFKKARKAYKQARKAAKRAARNAKEAQKKLATFKEILKRAKRKPARKPRHAPAPKGEKQKARPAAAKRRSVVAQKPAAEMTSTKASPTPPADSILETPLAD